ncbi:PH domain-containing protein [Sphingomonas sp.]|uniref:PH domain-containing protein n=1 Tax=Sphingomonas sp. TaxID=28214 RepID=UPI00286E2E1C|nr:PH domain-containing protein [Sphingomonas sp.]
MSDGEAPSEVLQAVEPGYRHVLRARLLVLWIPLIIAGLVFDQLLLDGTPAFGLPSTALPLFALIAVTFAPKRIYDRLRYGLAAGQLRLLRGWLFHTDTIVPLVRVQHLDVTRGPLDKMFGTASLIVHTAGTHNSIVTVPGLAPARAAEMRDVIRDQVRTDFL